jgi:hypothetical protein
MEVESRIAAWNELLRALRGNDRDAFLAIIAAARRHEDAAGLMNPVDPAEGMLLSILIEQEKRIRRIEGKERVEAGAGGGVEGHGNGEGGPQSPLPVSAGMLLSILVEQEKRLKRLEKEEEAKKWREALEGTSAGGGK